MKKFAGVFAAVSLISAFGAAPALAQEPELVEASAPEFPRAAERREIEGHVVVRYNVTADGAVSDVEVVEATPAGVFERSVLELETEESEAVRLLPKVPPVERPKRPRIWSA